jgi:branched-chain amino acid transport system substrate-binding protein
MSIIVALFKSAVLETKVFMKRIERLICILFAFIFLITTAGIVLAKGAKVGVILPLTGKLAMLGEIEKNSYALALQEINSEGGVNGKEIELLIKDTAGSPDAGRSAIHKLISQDNVIVVCGGISSSVAWTVAASAQEHKIPFVVNSASADKITEQGWQYIFRINPPVSEYPQAMASFLNKIARVRTASVIYENTPFGLFGVKKIMQLGKKLTINLVMKEGYEPAALDFRPLLAKIEAKNPDLVYIISNVMDAALLLRQAKDMNLIPGLLVGFSYGFTSTEFLEIAGDASNYVCSPTLWTPSVPYPGAKKYYNNYVAMYNSPTDYHGAQAYAAMYVIADALKRAQSLARQDIRNALCETDMMTVFGPVRFVSYGKKSQQNKLPTLIVQWINGKLETVWPPEIASTGYVYPSPK